MRFFRSSSLLFGLAGALLASGAAQANCNLAMVAELPAKIDNGKVFIPGTLGGQAVDFLVDLGSPSILLTIAAERMSIKLSPSSTLGKVISFGEPGPDQFNVANLPIMIGGGADNLGSPQAVVALGLDFFANYDVEYDVGHGRIVLYKPTGCEKAKLAYWPGPSSSADMVANPQGHPSFPPYTGYNYPQMNIRLQVDGKEMLAAIDTGYSQSTLSTAAARSAGLTTGGEGVAEIGPTTDLFNGFSTPTWGGSVSAVTMGQETIAPAKLAFRSFAREGSTVGEHIRRVRYQGDDMMLGADFLIAHRVFVSQSQAKIYFSPAENATFLGSEVKAAASVAGR